MHIMAGVFKRKRRVKLASGKTIVRESKCWYIEYQNKDGTTKVYRIKDGIRVKALEYLTDEFEDDIMQEHEFWNGKGD